MAKRIDIAAVALFHEMTVDEMSDLDLSYTPPLGSPWDAVQAGAQTWVRESGQLQMGAVILAIAAVVLGASAPSSAGTRTASVALTGAGSTFDAPYFNVAFAKYHQLHRGVTIGYSAVGSGAGIKSFSNKQVNFGATDVPMTSAEQAGALGGKSVQVPIDLGAEVVVFNLAAPTPIRLDLTGPVIAAIFLGQITNWRNPAIVALNPKIDLPDEAINVVHRSDSSGTTYIFSNYLASVDSKWASKVGVGKTLNWPVGVGAQGNPGVATAVAQTPYSIGYVERSYSAGPLLNYAAIRNRAGRYSVPYATSIAAAAAQKAEHIGNELLDCQRTGCE